MSMIRPLSALSLVAASALVLAGCASNDAAAESPEESAPAAEEAPASVTFTDNNGEHTVDLPIESVVATDNRTFQTLDDWDIELTAAARALMPSTISYRDDESIVDLGVHNEPDLEAIVAADPDLVINGQRFTQFEDKIAELVPDATIVALDPREGESFDGELKRQVEVLGQIFGKEEEAEKIEADFDAAVERVKAAYDADQTVMSVITSGGEIGYSAPGAGRTFGPLYELLGLTPALEVEDSSTDHQGDDISVEAIADSNPDWLLVLDRDAAILAEDPEYVAGADVIEGSEPLANVTAVKEGNVVYMPADTYTNESIQTYTEFLNELADALEAAA
ncbi:iron ABC transporter substrate-binding protein [Microbacterium nanhaiense]|uniref:Iron ABC transporter substrate-binding protein n=1 Tax=Microbacterium nanhaiense TaxID=1301026 RepID=A0ABQ2N539_9MICO|nr:ABC transporter substrate-binding protein [Microbacterium nanhaiense]GGO65914.1 iron ABC transporter substrate-binding protein [Microbacterium nanhaiense]